MDIKLQDDASVSVFEAPAHFRRMSCEQLENLGLDEIAYVKPVMTQSGPAFSIHAADGKMLAIATTEILASAAIIQNNMVPQLVN